MIFTQIVVAASSGVFKKQMTVFAIGMNFLPHVTSFQSGLERAIPNGATNVGKNVFFSFEILHYYQ